jgi:hypothetical protein
MTASLEATRMTVLPHAIPTVLKPAATGLLHGCQAVSILHRGSSSLLVYDGGRLTFMSASSDKDGLPPAIAAWRVVPLAKSGDLEWPGMPLTFEDKCATAILIASASGA